MWNTLSCLFFFLVLAFVHQIKLLCLIVYRDLPHTEEAPHQSAWSEIIGASQTFVDIQTSISILNSSFDPRA
jgi:hypothetical protein